MEKISLHPRISQARDDMTREIFQAIDDLDLDVAGDCSSPRPLDLILEQRQLELIRFIGELLAQGADIDEPAPKDCPRCKAAPKPGFGRPAAC